MADDQQPVRPAPDVTESGVPAVDEVPEEMVRTGDIGEGEMPPLEHAQGAEEWGTTAAEQQRPETLEERLMREEPDLFEREAAGLDAEVPTGVRPFAGPDSPGGLVDPDSDLVADEDALPEDTLAPEEAAVRPTEDLPGATFEATPGYVEED
jgi:hypothetical protein